MSDNEVFDEDDIAGDVTEEDSGGKRGFIPQAILKILRWVALGLAAIIFIVTVVVITVMIMNRGPKAGAYPAPSANYTGQTPILSWYDIPEIRTRTADESSFTVIVDPKLGYQQNDKKIQTELIARREQIIDMMRRYFSEKTADQLTPKYEMKIKAELKQMINEMMESKGIEEIVFLQFNVIQF